MQIQGYSILEKINRNPNVSIFRAKRKKDNLSIVIKFIPSNTENNRLLVNLKNEYEILKYFNTENVIKLYSFDILNEGYALILEDGGISLKEYLYQKNKLDILTFLEISIHIVDILNELHSKKIVHKDIKPTNILIQHNEDASSKVKIIDFGISTRLSREETGWKSLNILEGSLPYISPEQTGRVNRLIDYRTDFYSLGVTFYELLTSKLPFQYDDPIEMVYSHIARFPEKITKLRPDVPKAIEDIINKLMEKNAENRYQSAIGLKLDLEFCLEQWKAKGKIEGFVPGLKDQSDKFQIPQKLYGREEEIKRLLSIFDMVSKSSQLLLVSGYSGIGKSAFVQETHKPITEKNGYFIKGKFDQFQRNIPFSALIQAFRELMNMILSEPDNKLNEWKENIQKAVGANGQVVIDVIPELEFVIGKQKPILELGPTENQARFNMTFQNFISVFTRKEHPIVLFIDDLQWADIPSLNLIKLLTTNSDSKHLMIIGAYRDNEVDANHPLMNMIDEVQKSGTKIQNIHISPLTKEHVLSLVMDTLNVKSKEKLEKLSELLTLKTAGNPFFLSEFLKALYNEEIIDFDYKSNIWIWNDEKIFSYGITDNVIDLMIKKLKQLPEITRELLSYAACLGSQFQLGMLSIIAKENTQNSSKESFTIQNIAKNLWNSIDEGMIIPIGEAQSLLQLVQNDDLQSEDALEQAELRFQHDRVQQAAYSFISEEKKKELHLKIGQLLLKNTPTEKLEENLFDILGHLNMGSELILEEKEKISLIELNLRATKKAKNATAYDGALKYAKACEGLLPANKWEVYYSLTLDVYRELSECEYLATHFQDADRYYEEIYQNAKDLFDKIPTVHTQLRQKASEGKGDEAFKIGFEILNQLGINMPDLSDGNAVNSSFGEYLGKFQSLVGNKPIPELYNLPEAKDKIIKEAISLITNLGDIAIVLKPEFLGLMSILGVVISIKHGNAKESSISYVMWGVITNLAFKDYKTGYELGQLSLRLAKEKFPNEVIYAKSLAFYGWNINHWVKHCKEDMNIAKEGFELTMKNSDIVYAGYFILMFAKVSFFTSMPLKEVIDYNYKSVLFGKKYRYNFISNMAEPTMQFALALDGKTNSLTSFNDSKFNEEEYIKECGGFGQGLAYFYMRKFQIYYLYGEYQKSLTILPDTEKAFFAIPRHIVFAELHFFIALTIIANQPNFSEEEKKTYLPKLEESYQYLKMWESLCKDNFEDKLLLVEAEKARVEKRDLEAMQLYEKAIESALVYGFTNDAAIINERAGLFYLEKGLAKVANIYWKESRKLYSQWGASAKVKQLEEKYNLVESEQWKVIEEPELDHSSAAVDIDKTISTTTYITKNASTTYSQMLDLTSIVRASQALSSEIEYEKLIEKLIKIVIESAGAERVVLLSKTQEGNLIIEAEGTANEKQIYSENPISLENRKSSLAISIIQYIARSKSNIVISDASTNGQFKNDPYILSKRPRSILCSPITNKGKLTGILYLENNITTGAFTEERVETLYTLASQAAISIENARLYRNIENVTREKTRISTEMDIAEQIQTSLLVEKPLVNGYKVLPYMKTADEVGGDYYDVINDGEKDWFVIGDVSGHGVTAGLIMMMVQTAIHTVIETAKDLRLAEKMKKVNHIISQNIKMMKLDKYMTLTLLFKEKDTFYFSGLHQDILVYRKEKQIVETVETVGSWLGLEDVFSDFYVDSFTLNSGDVFLLYTDGITEANHKQTGKMLLNTGLVEFFTEVGNKSNEEIKKDLLGLLENYITKDDVTFMLVRKE